MAPDYIVQTLSKRSHRLALLAQFIEALNLDERVGFLEALRITGAVSEPSIDALEEVYVTDRQL